MPSYTPNTPFNVAAYLSKATTTSVKGVTKKTYTKSDQPFFCSFKTFGGTETQVNGVTVVENTGKIETWYNPDITADCRITIDDVEYEILGTPENINMRNQYMVIRLRAIKGGA